MNFIPKKFIFTDYPILSAVNASSGDPIDIFLRICPSLPLPPTFNQLCGGIARLSACGFIQFSQGNYSLTQSGREFFSKNKKFLESRAKRDARLKEILTVLPFEPSYDICRLPDTDTYFEALKRASAEFTVVDPIIDIQAVGDNIVFAFSEGGIHPERQEDKDIRGEADEIDQSRAVFTCPVAAGYDILTAFCRAVCDMTFTYIPLRKLCFSCTDGSYVLTLSKNTGAVRITAAPIKYNRQRFGGKENGDLDYAQCGEIILDVTIPRSRLARDTAFALASLAWAPDQPAQMKTHPFPLKEMQDLSRI